MSQSRGPATVFLLLLAGGVAACADTGAREASAGGSVGLTSITSAGGSTSSGTDGSTGAPTGSGSVGTDPGAVTSTSSGAPTGTGTSGTGVGTSSDGSSAGLEDTGAGTTSSTSGGTSTGGDGGCSDQLQARVRDFSQSHPDFESFSGSVKGLVEPVLGADHKPIHAAAGPTQVTSGPANFQQWYNDVPGVNQPFTIQLALTEIMPGIYQYKNSAFFPIDGQGLGDEGNDHNFHFTTEIHTEFEYGGGEVFTFTGDDDLWMFINDKLAIDLGGVHGELSQTIQLDEQAAALGITKGNSYAMDIFHAERHTSQSNFRIDTTIACFVPQ